MLLRFKKKKKKAERDNIASYFIIRIMLWVLLIEFLLRTSVLSETEGNEQ